MSSFCEMNEITKQDFINALKFCINDEEFSENSIYETYGGPEWLLRIAVYKIFLDEFWNINHNEHAQVLWFAAKDLDQYGKFIFYDKNKIELLN